MVSFLAMTQMSILITAQLTKPLAQYEVKDLPVKVKGQGSECEADHLCPSGTKIKKTKICTFTVLYIFMI